MNVPKELYKRFNSHRLAQFFLYLLFTSDSNGDVKTTLRQMEEDNEMSTKWVSKALEELKTLGATETKTKQRGNNETTTKKVAKKSTYDYSFVEPNLQTPFEEWLKYKRVKNQMYKRQQDLVRCYNKLKEFSKGNTSIAMKIVEQSMANNWSGLFELKEHDKSSISLQSSEMNYDKFNDWK